tara:strand:- start:105 stop:353 length:249 start_codon:yes stop_codon:yes gene_type:complete
MKRKSKKIKELEKKYKKSMDEIIVDAILECGDQAKAARSLGINKAVIGNWIRVYNIRVEVVAVLPGHTVSVSNPGERVELWG